MSNDITIARGAKKLPIGQVGKRLGIEAMDLIPFGYDKAKISNHYLASLKQKKDGKLILVTAINPTPAGEGKTTTSIGLADALKRLDKKAHKSGGRMRDSNGREHKGDVVATLNTLVAGG